MAQLLCKTARTFLKKSKQKYHMILQPRFWVHIQNNCKQSLKDMFAHLCSLQYYSQKPRGGSKPKYPSTDEQINKMWSRHAKGFPVLKEKKITSDAATWTNPGDLTLSGVNQLQKDRHGCLHLRE